jgi:Flp pilus assembly protein TadG
VAGRKLRAKRAKAAGRSESGQAVVLSVVWMVVLLGMAGLVIDVGSWYRSQRDLQADADAAALAGAQELPNDTSTAGGLAKTYASKNGFVLPTSGITISGTVVPDDSITVKVDKNAPTFFSKVFGVATVPVRAEAMAKSSLMGSAKYVAPIAVNIQHPMLSGVNAGVNCPCFDVPTTLPLGKTGAPGAFALIDLDGNKGGTGASDLGAWIQNGYDQYLDLGDYFSNTGAKFDSTAITDSLGARIGTVLMFPVYDTLTGTGVTALYHVVAWVGFRVDSFTASGNDGTLTGVFTSITWEGLPATQPNSQPNLGARVVELIH